MPAEPIRLTSLAHGGGCGCKLAPSVLRELLDSQPLAGAFSQLLVGTETGDDAAVWQVDGNTCIIATTDFFTPIVDDPFDFGRIAATNAISDVYAMGGKPIMALAILGIPIGKIGTDAVRLILQGGAQICASAEIPVSGGHSIDVPEPIYGLAVVGICRPEHVRRNAGALPGDALILTKPLGVGIYSAAIKADVLNSDGYRDMIAITTQLNAIGTELARSPDVHAITDVTGFGLLGHAIEVARGSQLALTIRAADVPLLPQTASFAQRGLVTGASHRNWASYGDSVSGADGLPDWQRHILTDPQTSGGLFVSCAPERAKDIAAGIVQAGFAGTRIIGHARKGNPAVTLGI